mmetsp:Transcript_68571/g.101901  ORF Transcript_68571/g.101901 Transcript_68571/m.101901 type:complete len:98 (+) Transcript_68571:139-432(+)
MHCHLTEKTLSFLNRRLFILLPPLQFCQLKDDTVTSQYSSVLPIALFESHCIHFLFLVTILIVSMVSFFLLRFFLFNVFNMSYHRYRINVDNNNCSL